MISGKFNIMKTMRYAQILVNFIREQATSAKLDNKQLRHHEYIVDLTTVVAIANACDLQVKRFSNLQEYKRVLGAVL